MICLTKHAERIQDRNEAMVIQDITLLVVPSVQNLTTYGFRSPTHPSGTVAAVIWAILSAMGFSALGTVASSAAAGSQASLGIVEAGSLYAWCLSAAIGRAAVNAFIAQVQRVEELRFLRQRWQQDRVRP